MSWLKFWTTPYSIANCCMFGKQYTKSCWDELGIGFSEVHFIIKERLATVFRLEEEQEIFNKTLSSLFEKNQEKAKEIIEKALTIQKKLYGLFDHPDCHSLEFFQRFQELYNQYLPYFLAIMWSANKLNNQKDKELLKVLESGRKETEKFYVASEAFLNRYYNYLKREKKNETQAYTALTDNELEEYLKTKKLPNLELLQKRYEFCLVSTKKGKITLYHGEEAKKKVKELKLEKEIAHQTEIKGIIAQPGWYKGKVKIVLRKEDIQKFKEGDVLVTAMTRPDWTSAIAKAGAIVTDVGGILCHAAIVSRELKKPCIIGTKIATQILKDGDYIEVDANKGIVRKINNQKEV